MTRARLAIVASALVSLAAACAGNPGPQPAGPPLRPKAKPLPPIVVEDIGAPPDCSPIKPHEGGEPKKFSDRLIDMGASLATQGLELLLASEESSRGAKAVERLIIEAVGKFKEALAADPYNVKATYNLAAAYARIGRKQCSLNLLARLADMASWPSKKDEIEDAADRLFGRGKKWKGRPDPDFDDLRSDADFLDIVKDLD